MNAKTEAIEEIDLVKEADEAVAEENTEAEAAEVAEVTVLSVEHAAKLH